MINNIILVNTKHLFTMIGDGWEQVEPLTIKRFEGENYYEMQRAVDITAHSKSNSELTRLALKGNNLEINGVEVSEMDRLELVAAIGWFYECSTGDLVVKWSKK